MPNTTQRVVLTVATMIALYGFATPPKVGPGYPTAFTPLGTSQVSVPGLGAVTLDVDYRMLAAEFATLVFGTVCLYVATADKKGN